MRAFVTLPHPPLILLLACAVVLCAAGAGAAADVAAPAAATSPAPVSPAVKVAELLPRLDDDDFRVRQQAATLLKNLPGDAWPAVERAAARRDLSTETRTHLDVAGRILRARARNENRYNDLNWNRESAVAAYRSAGRRSPKWDAAAEEALRRFPRPSIDPRVRPTDDRARMAPFEAAVAAGCDDPLVLYCYARAMEEAGDADAMRVTRLYRAAADGMRASRYPAVRKCFALVRGAATRSAGAGGATVREALALLPAAAREPGVRPSNVQAVARLAYEVLARRASAAGRTTTCRRARSRAAGQARAAAVRRRVPRQARERPSLRARRGRGSAAAPPPADGLQPLFAGEPLEPLERAPRDAAAGVGRSIPPTPARRRS